MKLSTKAERLTDSEDRLVIASGRRGWGGMGWEFGVSNAN